MDMVKAAIRNRTKPQVWKKIFFQFFGISGRNTLPKMAYVVRCRIIMRLIVKKSRLRGTVSIPASKSHTIRAVAIGSLAAGKSLVRNPLDSSDTLAAVGCYRALGAAIDTSDPNLWRITGTGGKIAVPQETVDVCNSGTTLNIAIGSAALAGPGRTITFTGDAQTQTRPVGPLMDSLNDLGAKCVSLKNNGGFIQMRSSSPISSSTISMLSIASIEGITPSVRLKPMAKSSRSWGVAIITA
jgi:5-enolpyruvylshikimate-3-phosphate synthase